MILTAGIVSAFFVGLIIGIAGRGTNHGAPVRGTPAFDACEIAAIHAYHVWPLTSDLGTFPSCSTLSPETRTQVRAEIERFLAANQNK